MSLCGRYLSCGMLICAISMSGVNSMPARSGKAGIILESKHMALRFDRQTGAWISFVDRSSGKELIVGPRISGVVPPVMAPKVDSAAIDAVVGRGKAMRLDGEWQYCPEPKGGGEPAGFLKGRFGPGEWAPTPVPSQSGVGDNKLHDRVGQFWYRTTFIPSAAWAKGDLMLVIGAVDDTDVAYLNGTRIGSTGLDTPHNWEAPRFYRIPARLIRQGAPNTLLVNVYNGAYDGGIAGPVVIGQASELRPPLPPVPALKSARIQRKDGAAILRLTARVDPFEYEMAYTLSDGQPSVTRTMTVSNASAQQQTFFMGSYPMPAIRLGAAQSFSFPGSLPVGENPVSRLVDGEAVRSKGQDPLAILWDGTSKLGVGAWFHSEDEWSPVTVRRVGDGTVIQHVQEIVAPLKPGESVTMGTQYIWLGHGARDDLLRTVQVVYKSIGLRTPSKGLSNLPGKILYCGHPGGVPETNYRGYGGFKAIEAYLPTLRRMSVDLLWLLPIWEHGDGSYWPNGWNLYSPFDHFKVSPIYGTPEDLKHLSAEGTKDGIDLMFDLVPHGPPDFTPLAKEHPEWLSREQDGKPVYNWSQYAFDYAMPGWQDYMRRAAELDAREYGAVGARIDCGAGGPTNWHPTPGLRPSQSGLYGGLGMNKAIRDGFLKVHKQAVLMPEEYTGANVFYRVSDITYDAMLFFVMCDLQARKASPAEWAESFRQFLHDQSLTLPPGALKMRFISNHDTVSWTFQAKRPIDVYGIDHMRALLSLCALIDGVPMLYQGDEDPSIYGGKGGSSVEFLSKLYGLRKSIPALRGQATDYTSVKASGGVFACLRKSSKGDALVLISFNPASVQSNVSQSTPVSDRWVDRMSGEELKLGRTGTVSMGPYQVRVLTPANGEGVRP